jgi:hypothetical protein
MKKLLLIGALALFISNNVNAQDSKFYLGIGVGYASAGGDYDEYNGGIAFDFFDMGYRFNESWGITLGLNSAGHTADVDGLEATMGVASFAIGPMYSFPAGNMRWDFKPQYAFSMAGVIDVDGLSEDIETKGSGFIIGNSLVIGDGSWQWSIDADYVMGKFDEIEYDGATDSDFDAKYNSFRIGVGLRYNF